MANRQLRIHSKKHARPIGARKQGVGPILPQHMNYCLATSKVHLAPLCGLSYGHHKLHFSHDHSTNTYFWWGVI